ncbi:MAG TPA: CdaR family protein [Candidatus Limnocylindrales bacterium]
MTVRRAVAFLVRNWPLKLAAIALATVLYSVFVLTQNTRPFDGSIPIRVARQPASLVLLTNLTDVTRVRYFASDDGVTVNSSSFQASVDLSGLDPKLGSASVAVDLRVVDPRIQVIEYSPRRVNVRFDQLISRVVQVRVDEGAVPAGLDVRPAVLTPSTVTVNGPAGDVRRIDAAVARVQIDPSGIDIDRQVELTPVDAVGEPLRTVEVQPSSVRVQIPVLANSKTRTLPVAPNVTGTPAPGFEVASVSVQPLVVTVAGDIDQLSSLTRADTEPLSVNGTTRDIVRQLSLALPTGVVPVDAGAVQVTVKIRPVTATRSFSAGIALVGARSDRTYVLSTDQVLVTLGGSIGDLDRMQGQTFDVQAEVGGLGPGTHDVKITANLPAGLALVGASPPTIAVTVAAAAPASVGP